MKLPTVLLCGEKIKKVRKRWLFEELLTEWFFVDTSFYAVAL